MGDTKVTKKNVRKAAVPKKDNPAEYTCLICGETHDETFFLKAYRSKIWVRSNNFCLICEACVDKLFEDFQTTYNKYDAFKAVCHCIDVPYVQRAAQKVLEDGDDSRIWFKYTRNMGLTPNNKKSFVTTMLSGELFEDESDTRQAREKSWSAEDAKTKQTVIDIIGDDPFSEFTDTDKKYLYPELLKYFDGDDEIADDPYKLSQLIQLVINNGQIHRCDKEISKMKPSKNADEIRQLNTIKRDLVAANDKIAKENEISVKNRSNKDIGKGTLTYLMRDMRRKNLKEAEANYYNQLQSSGTQWACDISNRSIMENCRFDDNDINDIIMSQRKRVQELQSQCDDKDEQIRLLKVELSEVKKQRGKK